MSQPLTTHGASRATSSVRRQEILDTATAVFAEKGIVATTVRDISERAGILSGSLYHHFTSKVEMIAEILGPVVTSQADAFDRIVTRTDDPIEILRLGIAAAIAQTAANPSVARILQQDEHQIRDYPGLESVVVQRRAVRDRLESAIVRGIAAGQLRADLDPRIATMALFDVVLGAYRHLEPIGRHSVDELVHQLTSLTLEGMRSRPGSRRRRSGSVSAA